VGVVLDGEEDVLPARELAIVRLGTGMPPLARHFEIRGLEELLTLVCILADEDHERRFLIECAVGQVPPPGQERVVAAELLEVLVDPARAVVLDEEPPRPAARSDLDDRVGTDEAWPLVDQPLG
jgi:hypothetical protein